jgi:hypothetical protein
LRSIDPTLSYGQYLARVPGGDLSARAKAELVADVLDVALGGALRKEEARGYLLVCQAFGDERGDLELARRER